MRLGTAMDIASLWNFSDPAASEQRFREALAGEEAARDAGLRAELLTQVARAQGLQRRFDDARATLDSAGEIAGDRACRASVRLHLETGRLLNSSRSADRGEQEFTRALHAAEEINEDGLAVDAMHMLAIIAPDTDAALRWNLKALGLAESSDQLAARKWLPSLLNNIGWTHHDAGRFEEALATFRRAQAELEANHDKPVETRIARWAVARAMRSIGRCEEALAIHQSLLEEYQKVNAPDGYVREEIGECLLALGRAEEARSHFAAAHKLLSQDPYLSQHETERLGRMKLLGAAPRGAG